MKTTTIRVDLATHRHIQRIHQATGKPMMEVVRDAVAALDRVRFAATVTRELDDLRADPVAWEAYLGDGEALPAGDGLA